MSTDDDLPREGTDMHKLAVSLAVAAALATLPCAAWYASSAPSIGAMQSPSHQVTMATAAPASARIGIELPIGVHLPADAVLVGTPLAVRHDGGHSDWRAEVRLPRTTASAALDALEAALTEGGWQVQRGTTDVFAVRRSGTRWELIQVLVDRSTPQGFHGTVIDVGIGSRTA